VSQAQVISDQNGNLYAVTEAGDLLHNRHTDGDPTKPLVYPGTGRRIPAQLQGFQHWISWSAQPGVPAHASTSHFAFIRSDGTVYYNRIDDLDVGPPHLPLRGLGSAVPGANVGSVRKIFCDKGGKVYWLSGGVLYQAQLTPTGNQATWTPGERTLVPDWMSLLYLFSAGPDEFFTVDLGGELRYYRKTWLGLRPLDVSDCWNTQAAMFAAGDGGIYSITTEGDLRYTRASVAGRKVSLTPPGYGVRVGQTVCSEIWELPPTIEGYCSPLSVGPGETVAFKLSITKTAASQHASVPYRVRFLRLRIVINTAPNPPGGYVESFDPEPMLVVDDEKEAILQSHDGASWSDGCGWFTCFELTIPNDGTWASGIYAAECCPVGADPQMGAWYVVFIVRPAAGDRSTALAVLSSTNTWNAYNMWGGKSKYHCYCGSSLPQQLSFERPNPLSCPSEVQTRNCTLVRAGTAHLTRAELWVLTWLEENGYPFHLYTDHDLDRGIDGISQGNSPYKALILNTHPEYWTAAMYDNLGTYLANGGSVIYLGGNGIYEQVELTADGKAMLVLQNASADDLNACAGEAARAPCLWRNLGRPETAILGVGFSGAVDWPVPKTPYDVKDSAHAFLAGVTDQTIGAAGLHGYASQWEMDVCDQNPSPGITLLARGTNDTQDPYGANMVCRQPTQQNFVFSAGSLGFGSSLVVDQNLQQVLKNVLNQAGVVASPEGLPPQGPAPVNRLTAARASAT